MRCQFVVATLTTALMAASMVMHDNAQAAPIGYGGVFRAAVDDLKIVDNVQVFWFGGRRYCWYDDGWHGPGWYWCGYAWRRGLGWGGGYGWHGWRGGHPGGGYHRGGGYHGGGG
jgi:hypothetical protein